jgi:hypothetical protein
VFNIACIFAPQILGMHFRMLLSIITPIWRVLHLLGNIVEVWIAISVATALFIFAGSASYGAAMRVKTSMAETDRTLPLPLYDRRRSQRGRYRLRLNRRQLTAEEGAMLETLHHAIDYLVQTYKLEQIAKVLPETRPPQLLAVEILLQKRMEMLAKHTPLPSFGYLLQRRIAYRLLAHRGHN